MAIVQTQVGLQVAGGGEAFFANLASMWLLTRVHQIMFLQMRQLGEPFVAFLAFVGALASVRSQMNLQVGQLAKGFGAFFALVACSAIHLLGVPEFVLFDVALHWAAAVLGLLMTCRPSESAALQLGVPGSSGGRYQSSLVGVYGLGQLASNRTISSSGMVVMLFS